jgi:cellulose synthase/poly-beta-1,6-N-acetylglucosamine synthase-like glycosyltransferase
MISVIIPVYNGEKTLGRCLTALFDQTQLADEILVVDDGSTDGTADLVHDFMSQMPAQPTIRLIRQANAGPAAARNAGARAAHGDVLLFTDADCAPTPDWTERMVAAFADPTVAGAKGVYQTRQTGLVPRFVQMEYESKYARMRGQERIDFIDTYSAGYRRDVFMQAGGFDSVFKINEDQEFSFRLSAAGHRLVFIPDACVEHIHDESLLDYVRRKFWIGYWKALVTRRHPSKLAKDSHTPQLLKVQMGLTGLGGILVASGALLRRAGAARWGLRCWVGFGVTTLPSLRQAWRKDRGITWLAPMLLFLRAWALGVGFVLGNLRLIATRSDVHGKP